MPALNHNGLTAGKQYEPITLYFNPGGTAWGLL